MKVVHWALKNGSGLANVAQEMCEAEVALELNSVLVDSGNKTEWANGLDGDIHVVHSGLPDVLASHPRKIYIAHGTPEHCFENGVINKTDNGGFNLDAWNLTLSWAREASVFVTFWERHAAIWDLYRPKNKPCIVLPMGVNKSKFFIEKSPTTLPGNPCLFSAENSHAIKWPFDLLMSWARIHENFPDGRLTIANMPLDQMRFWSPLVLQGGIYTKTFMLSHAYKGDALRKVLSSVGFYFNLVRYGDHNRMGIEAAACGAPIISYTGNKYAHYWISSNRPEVMDNEIMAILRGEVIPREIEEIVDVKQVAQTMKEIYEKFN